MKINSQARPSAKCFLYTSYISSPNLKTTQDWWMNFILQMRWMKLRDVMTSQSQGSQWQPWALKRLPWRSQLPPCWCHLPWEAFPRCHLSCKAGGDVLPVSQRFTLTYYDSPFRDGLSVCCLHPRVRFLRTGAAFYFYFSATFVWCLNEYIFPRRSLPLCLGMWAP